MRIGFLLPGDPTTRTGGYAYGRAMVGGLRGKGWTVDLPPLPDAFPWPDACAEAAAEQAVQALPDGQVVVADGLAFGALPDLAQRHAQRLRWVALVHHPLAMEADLSPAQRDHLARSERQALACARRVIVTSEATARSLASYGVPAGRVRVVPPGTLATAPGLARRKANAPLQWLCVATLTPRKGHARLIEALAPLRNLPWTLQCVGSTTRDPATARSVQALIERHDLSSRVQLLGELEEAELQSIYRTSDAAVLATAHEGYGMALAEALMHGLPVVSTAVGAVPDLIPDGAGLLVPPDDILALRQALARLMDDVALRRRLASGAREAARALPTWSQSVASFAAVLAEVAVAEAAL